MKINQKRGGRGEGGEMWEKTDAMETEKWGAGGGRVSVER